ncbi:hypothetical protein ACQKM9_03275 [Viridibacillus sp. NPDC093762]|uniref:hypothetical protein n=1 Tax=Viridibacillus sp. NPDC093762 TaxID=3390720 RepID=UPI003D07E00F
MDILGSNFDNSVINEMASQFGVYLSILVIGLLVLVFLFKMLKVPDKYAGILTAVFFLIIAYKLIMITS